MAKLVYATLRYDTVKGEGEIKFVQDPHESDGVVMFDTVGDWIYRLEALQKDLYNKLYKETTND